MITDVRWILILLLISLVIRAGWAVSRSSNDAEIDKLPDQREYLELGQNLLRTGELKFFDKRFGQDIYAYRTPGYPAFIAAMGARPRVIRLAQAMIDTSTVLAIYLLARKWLDRRASIFAACLVAFNPFLIFFCGLILSETLYIAMLAWGMMLLSRRRGVIAGILLLAISVYVRPSAILLTVCLAIAAATMHRPGVTWVKWREGAIAVVATIVVLLPWAYRNDRVLGQWIWTTTNGGITLYDGFNGRATGASDQKFLEYKPELKKMSETDRSKYLGGWGKQFIVEYPKQAAKLAVKKVLRTWSPVPLSDEYGKTSYRIISMLYAVPFDLLVLMGLLVARFGRPKVPHGSAVGVLPIKMFLLVPAIYFTVVHAMSVGSLRYRIPVEPPMAVLAAAGFCFWASSFRKKEPEAIDLFAETQGPKP